MKASQTPHKTNTRAVIIRKDLVSLASCKKKSGKSITLNKQSDADVKTNLNGIGTVISKRNMTGDNSSDMIAALSGSLGHTHDLKEELGCVVSLTPGSAYCVRVFRFILVRASLKPFLDGNSLRS
jgi:hypothetical protein